MTLPLVAGRFDRSLADFERSCLVHLADEQARIAPDAALVGLLCDAVRLSREQRQPAMEMLVLAGALRKVLPPALLDELVAHLDPLTPFLLVLRAGGSDGS